LVEIIFRAALPATLVYLVDWLSVIAWVAVACFAAAWLCAAWFSAVWFSAAWDAWFSLALVAWVV
jgi:hypothetical protein